MDAKSGRWRRITPSQFQWETEALEYLRARLPDTDPIQAWSNFEFVSGGAISEVDLLVATRKGMFLIEIKSHPGKITGGQGQWTWHRPDGSRGTFDNPLLLANSKAKRLKGLLQRKWVDDNGDPAGKVPFIKAMVFLSDPSVEVGVSPELAPHVVVRDLEPSLGAQAQGATSVGEVRGVLEVIHTIGAGEAGDTRFRQFTNQDAERLVRAMQMVGIKESGKSRRVGAYVLTLPAFAERGNTQDFLAQHEQHGTLRRVRIFSNVVAMSPEQSRVLKDAATREYLASERLHIDGVVRALDQLDTDLGPAVIYDHDRGAVRLDRFLGGRGDELDLGARLRIILRLADTLRQVHGRRVTHRMLTPQSVWLRPVRRDESDHGEQWIPEISDFSMAATESANSVLGTTFSPTRFGRLPTAAAGDIEAVLADPSVEAYLAPECYSAAQPDGRTLDVFSVGVIAYLLCAGVPPAANRFEMHDALGLDGLRVSARIPEIEPAIDDFIREATCPVVSNRFQYMGDLVAGIELALEVVESGVSDETVGAENDPLTARPNDTLGGRYCIKRRLGKGSTALALLCFDTTAARDVVLKVSLGGSADDRIRAEAQALDGLHHRAVVELYEMFELAGRPALVLAFAGAPSVDQVIRKDGPASPEFLQRWGTDLLEAVRYLEREGRSHRDIKPENLGIVAQGKNDENHLVLFDFSLAGTPITDLNAGTPGYLEPFLELRDPKAWDLWAERYAVVVTLHELATGELPRWGDGQTNPAFTEGEAAVSIEALDPELREPLGEFFARGLRRQYTERFDTAEDMLRAWQRAFEGLDAEVETEAENEEIGLGASEGTGPTLGGERVDRLPEKLRLDDPILSLGVKGKLRSALRRLGVTRVGDLSDLDPATVNRTKGVSPGSRKAILRLRSAVLTRFAEELAPTVSPKGATTTPAEPIVSGAHSGSGTLAEQPGATDNDTTEAGGEVVRLDLDSLALRLVPPRGRRGREGSVAEAVRLLLALTPIEGDSAEDWPTNNSVAVQLSISSAAVFHALQKARAHWLASSELLSVSDDVTSVLADLGGAASVSELAEALLEVRGSGADSEDAIRLSGAVLRAVVECAGASNLPLVSRRFGHRTLVALEGVVALGDDKATFDSATLLALATALGKRADQLVGSSPLVASSDAVAALRSVSRATSAALADGRLVRLAAAASSTAVANAAADLVLRSPVLADALRWSRPSLVANDALTESDIADRVRVRFPTAVLPGHPDLDALIQSADLPLRWDDERSAYVKHGADPGALTTFTRQPSRHETIVHSPTQPIDASALVATDQITPEVQAAINLEDHLKRSMRDGGFLALRVPADSLRLARAELARFQGPPNYLVSIDLERRFLTHLRSEADRRGVSWAKLTDADAAGRESRDWPKLTALTGPAVDMVIAEVVAAGPRVIAWFPGVLVRHQSTTGLGAIEQLHEAVASRTGGLSTLWLVVVGSTVSAKPTIDGTAVPVLGPVEWADVNAGWLRNLHRAEGLSA
jgi:serine/threonine protein kinase